VSASFDAGHTAGTLYPEEGSSPAASRSDVPDAGHRVGRPHVRLCTRRVARPVARDGPRPGEPGAGPAPGQPALRGEPAGSDPRGAGGAECGLVGPDLPPMMTLAVTGGAPGGRLDSSPGYRRGAPLGHAAGRNATTRRERVASRAAGWVFASALDQAGRSGRIRPRVRLSRAADSAAARSNSPVVAVGLGSLGSSLAGPRR
jgi:hypothetical protein